MSAKYKLVIPITEINVEMATNAEVSLDIETIKIKELVIQNVELIRIPTNE